MLTVSASTLQKKSPRIIALKKEIKSILYQINRKILEASRLDLCDVRFSPLLHFSIPGLSNQDSQNIIFGQIIEELEEKEFDVSIDGTGDNVEFVISWDVSCGKKEINKYHSLILAHHKNFKDAQLKRIENRQKELNKLKASIQRSEQIKRLAL